MQRYEKVFLFGVLSALLIGCAGTIARVDTQSPEPMRDSSTPNTRPTPNSTSGIWADRLVAPGVGTNSVRLGMSRDELVALLDKPNEEYDQKGLCTYSEMHWYLTNPDQSVGGDIFAFLRDGKVFELMFGDGFYTSAGIRYNTGLEDLKEKIGAPIFELTKSSNTATNYQNLFFMIEKEKGIAYEIAAGYKTKKRGVSAIYVFYPNNDFLPWGCIDEIQNLVKISGSP